MAVLESLPWKCTLKTAAALAFNAVLVIWAALGLTWALRSFALPSHAYLSVPLNFAFSTCRHGDGVCSFPVANASLKHADGGSLLSPGLPYWLRVELHLPDSPPNRALGMFLLRLRLWDTSKVLLVERERSTSVPYRSWALRALRTALHLPLLLFTDSDAEYHTIGIDFFTDFQDSPLRRLGGLSVEVQSRRLVMMDGRLRLSAVFGHLGGFLYWWPITSSTIIAGLIGACLAWLSFLYWARRGIAAIAASAQAYEQRRREQKETENKAEKAEALPAEELPVKLPKAEQPDAPLPLPQPEPEPETELRRRKAFASDESPTKVAPASPPPQLS